MKEKLHIIPHNHAIDRSDRERMKDHRAQVIWFTGLSGSGKSTLANTLEQELYKMGVHTYILDGDNVRTGLNKDLDFTEQGRVENIRRIGQVAKLFADAGVVVLTAFISPFKADRQQAREIIGSETFTEVFIDTPLEICEQRDVKGLYKKARAGEISNFTGISSPFEAPDSPDIHIETADKTLEASTKELLSAVTKRLNL